MEHLIDAYSPVEMARRVLKVGVAKANLPVAGAELFTGNNLVAMAWASRLITTKQVARNWVLVYIGNFFGSVGTALLVYWSGTWALEGNGVALNALGIAAAAGRDLDPINLQGLAGNLVPVTLGNIIGGTLLVAGVYWFAYLRAERRSSQAT